MRWQGFKGDGRPITNTTAQVVSFSEGLPSTGVVAFHFWTTGALNTFANITGGGNVNVLADSDLIYSVNPTHLRKWSGRFTQGNYLPATTVTAFSLWFNFVDIVDDDAADNCQFPRGAVPTIQFSTNATVVTGSMFCAWTISDQPASFFPRLFSQPMNIAANQVNAPFPIKSRGGLARGYVVDTVGLDKITMKLGGFQPVDMAGPGYLDAANGDVLRETEQIECDSTLTGVHAGRLPQVPIPGGTSEVVLTTHTGGAGGNWAGATNPLTLWTQDSQ